MIEHFFISLHQINIILTMYHYGIKEKIVNDEENVYLYFKFHGFSFVSNFDVWYRVKHYLKIICIHFNNKTAVQLTQ